MKAIAPLTIPAARRARLALSMGAPSESHVATGGMTKADVIRYACSVFVKVGLSFDMALVSPTFYVKTVRLPFCSCGG